MYNTEEVINMLNERKDEISVIENYYEEEYKDFTYYFSCPAELVKMLFPILCKNRKVDSTHISLLFHREKEDVQDYGEIETANLDIAPVSFDDSFEDWLEWEIYPYELVRLFYNLAIKHQKG